MIRIRFKDAAEAASFVKIINRFEEDVNLYDGKNILDAKSIVSIMGLDFKKKFTLDIMTDNKRVIKEFEEAVKYYEA